MTPSLQIIPLGLCQQGFSLRLVKKAKDFQANAEFSEQSAAKSPLHLRGELKAAIAYISLLPPGYIII